MNSAAGHVYAILQPFQPLRNFISVKVKKKTAEYSVYEASLCQLFLHMK